MSATHTASHFRFTPRTRAALVVSAVALVVHLIPLFLPRRVPGVELDLARLVPDAAHRVSLLLPLIDNPRSTAANLRDAAELVLPASSTTARQFLAAADKLAPVSEDNELLRARICRADRDDPCVRRALARARELAPADPAPDLVEAEFAELSGDTDDVLTALGQAHRKSPQDAALGLRYARALASASRWTAAEQVFAELRPALPKPRARIEHGLMLLDGGAELAARHEFEAAVRETPKSAEAHYYLGVALFREQAWLDALSELQIADQLDRKDFRALALICAIERENGRLDLAAATRTQLDERFAAQRSQYDDACPL